MSNAEKISVTITPKMNRMIQKRVKAGDFASSSELIREALRVWELREQEHQERLAVIRARIDEAMDDPRPSVPAAEVFERLRARYEVLKAQRTK
jgi:antitoxin ParD1/3/4